MNHRPFSLSLLLVIVALLAAACAPAAPVCASQMASGGEFENVCGFEVSGNANEARLYVQVKLRKGRMTWKLENPAGDVVWTGSADSSQPVEKSARIVDPMPGMWRLRLESYKAVGEYTAPWVVE